MRGVFLFGIVKMLSHTGGSQCSSFHESAPSTELYPTCTSRNGSRIPDPGGTRDQKVLRGAELKGHTWKGSSGFTCSQTLVTVPEVCGVGRAFRVQTV